MNSESREIFQGTSVYYKIYNSPTQLLSHKTTIENIDTEYSDQGIGRLIDWGYQALTTAELTTANLVSASDSIKEVSIRLSNQTEDPQSPGKYLYPAAVTIDGTGIGIPLRSVDDKTFSFSATAGDDSPDSVPREGKGPYLPMIRMASFLYNMSLVTTDGSRNKNNLALINQWQMKTYIIDHVSCLSS